MGQELWLAPLKSRTYLANTGTLSLATEFGAKARLVMFKITGGTTGTTSMLIAHNGIAVSEPLCVMNAALNETRIYTGQTTAPFGNTEAPAVGGTGQLYMPYPCAAEFDNVTATLDPVMSITIGSGAGGSVTVFYTDDV